MIRKFAITGLLLAVGLSAQEKGKNKGKGEQFDFHPLMQQVWDAWGTMDPANAARFYSKDSERTFFDLAPMKYVGWGDYAAGVKKVFADYSSAKFTLSSEHVAQRPMFAWASAIGHATMTRKTGGKEDFDFRWTVLWEKEGSDWLIIHEHVSVPMAASAAKPATAPKAAIPTRK
jgi:ketosteroid isomerase-like protein